MLVDEMAVMRDVEMVELTDHSRGCLKAARRVEKSAWSKDF